MVIMSILVYFFFIIIVNIKAIYDPLGIFCGNDDCYELLELTRDCKQGDIKKAYRKLSVVYHPDKNKSPNATEIFRAISKASEVLNDLEQRELYDNYLDNPNKYYEISGVYVYKQLPKADVRLIVLGVILFLSALLPAVQYQRWRQAVQYLTHASLHNLGLKNGGSKQTMELYRRAFELYENRLNENRDGKSSSKLPRSGGKLSSDPLFRSCIDEVVSEVQIEGGYRKPGMSDVLAVKIVQLPYYLYKYLRFIYVKYMMSNSELLTEGERRELAIDAMGFARWHTLTFEEQERLLALGIWKSEVMEQYTAGKEEEFQERHANSYKRYNRMKKKMT